MKVWMRMVEKSKCNDHIHKVASLQGVLKTAVSIFFILCGCLLYNNAKADYAAIELTGIPYMGQRTGYYLPEEVGNPTPNLYISTLWYNEQTGQNMVADCGVVSLAMVEGYFKGYESNSILLYHNTIVALVTAGIDYKTITTDPPGINLDLGLSKSNPEFTNGYRYSDEVNWNEVYSSLQNGLPVLVHSYMPGNSANQHWGVIYGYSGSSGSTIDATKFLVLSPYVPNSTAINQCGTVQKVSFETYRAGRTVNSLIYRKSTSSEIGLTTVPDLSNSSSAAINASWYQYNINTTTPDEIHSDMSDKNPQITGYIRYENTRKVVEAGCFLSTNQAAVSGASRGNANGTFSVNETSTNGFAGLADGSNLLSRFAYTLTGERATAYGFGMSSSDIPNPGQTVYYKYYAVLDNGAVIESAAVQQFTMPGQVGTPPTITTATLPAGSINVAYSHALASTGDTPITWSLASGSLPAGMSLSSNGVISGTPTAHGSYNITVKATNAAGSITKALTLQVDLSSYSYSIVAGEGGTIATYPTSGTTYFGNTFLIQASANSGYVFSHWTATNNGAFDDATAANASFTMPAANTVITAHFIKLPVITTLSLDDGEVGKSYSMMLAANGTAPLEWAVSNGTLPVGLSLNTNGVISGTPTESGTISFAIQVSNSAGSDSREYTLKVNPKPVAPIIADYTFPNGVVGTEYSRPVIMTAGDTPFTFSLINGSLPDGLRLNTGYITGTPTTSGMFTFTIKVDNAVGSDSKEYTLVIDPKSVAPTITTASLPNGTVGVAYSQALAATGDAPISWSAEGTLPDGLTLSSSGTISGTPTAAGTSTFTVKASNGVEPDASVQLSITIDAAPVAPTITTTSLPNGTVGVAYSQTLAATGDAPITWTAEGDLPAGLMLSSNGTISGTPTAAGISIFTVKASNGVEPDASEQFTITISAAPVAPTITTTTLPNGTVGMAYSQALAATGDTPIIWTAEGDLPAGLTLSSNGTISGTPTAAGTSTFTVRASNGVEPDASVKFTITISAAPVAPTITTTTLPNGTVGVAYSQALAATGDTPITWTAEGTLPAGLTLSSNGTISGTPTAAGTSTFTVKASNGVAPDASAQFTITINAAPVAPTITTTSLPNGTVGVAYSQTLAATGDDPIIWTAEGTLPDGLTLSGNGTISGTPTAAGISTFAVKASNGVAPDASVQFTITISAAPVAPTITTTSLPNGTVGVAYGQTLAATGDAPIIWTAEGTLPAGLTLSSNGTISGTPTTAGTVTFTVKVSNGVAPDATKQLSITIESASRPPIMPVTIGPSATILVGQAPITNITIGAGVDGLSAANFDKLLIDGQLVLPGTDTFDVRTGSIILQMNPSYLNTLALGRHEVKVFLKGQGFEGVDVSTIITVVSAATGTDAPPKTGDNTPLLFYTVLMAVSLMLGLWMRKGKKNSLN